MPLKNFAICIIFSVAHLNEIISDLEGVAAGLANTGVDLAIDIEVDLGVNTVAGVANAESDHGQDTATGKYCNDNGDY